MSDQNTVYIGNKPPMSYVMAVIRTFNMFDADSVVLKARGRAISTAVDVAEIARQRFLSNINAAKIEIGTEQMPTPQGGTRGVSTIAITMEKETTAPAEEESKLPELDVSEIKPAEEESKSPELDVSEIKGVGGARAEKLKGAGYPTVRSLAGADPEKLSQQAGISENLSAKLVESAKELLKQG